MPQSKDQFILKLLALNVAKLGCEGKRKEAGGEGEPIGNVKELKRNKESLNGFKTKAGDGMAKKPYLAEKSKVCVNDMPEACNLPDLKSQSLAQTIVYHHLKETSPKLAAEFAAL